MATKIHLIRHGITEGNLKGWYYGSMDVPLANQGIDELVELAKEKIYPSAEDAVFYSSGMVRADQTLFLLYGEVQREVIENLREMNFGMFEGHTYEELKDLDEYQAWLFDDDLEAPKGESRNEFSKRVIEGFKELLMRHKLDKKDSTIAVCHGGVISVIMMTLFRNQREHFYEWIPDPGHGMTLLVENGRVLGYEEF